ncbi:acyl-CoA dehydrogenase [Rhodococcus qingshengii]|nr:acyl-CoA dehydrogenase [Rhodococcus qingshengii]
MPKNKVTKVIGGSFLLEQIESNSIVTPEDITDEQQMMVDMTSEFVARELIPNEEQLENLDYELTIKLLRKASEVGLLGVDIPEQYGGLNLAKVTSTYISEILGRTSSFVYSIGTQTGIGSLPIVYFGTHEQKQKYLPDAVTGSKIFAYCLTEPSSGSDALGAKSTAALSADGKHYILNGSKVFITNGGIADVFIVYAKVDAKHFSAFIVEKGMPGFTIGPEEKKMGLKASSTCPLFFDNVHVPVENLLGEVGKGHLIAFNILNLGRHKLPTNSLGAAKEALELSTIYAKSRLQFGTQIVNFPLIAKKLAEMNILIYALETMVYRTAGLFDQVLNEVNHSNEDTGAVPASAIAEYTIECSINKVFGTEVLDYVVDEGVQIHGGYGFTKDYKIERMYRDSRITRIFEGTNEINRLIIPGTLLKKALKGELPLLKEIERFQEMDIESRYLFDEILDQETYLESAAKKIFLMIAGIAYKKYQSSIEKEQEVMANLADILIQIYAMNGVLLRTKKMIEKDGEERTKNAIQMTQVFIHEAFDKVEAIAKEAIATMETGEGLQRQLILLGKISDRLPINVTALKRQIAERVSQEDKYVI